MNEFIHYFIIVLITVLPVLGVGIGQGMVNKATIRAIDEQPAADGALRRIAIIAVTLSETAVLLAVVTALLLITQTAPGAYVGWAYAGISVAIAVPGFFVGIISAFPAREALKATVRQPLFASEILQLFLITQAMIQTPTIFGFIIALLIKNQLPLAITFTEGVRLLAGGLVSGIGCLGPLVGLGMFAVNAMRTSGINRNVYRQLRTFTLVSQALIEAPIIFSLIIAIITIISKTSLESSIKAFGFLAAAAATGLSTVSAGINSGRISSTAVREIGINEKIYPTISRISIISQTLIDTIPIYGTLIALLIILF